MIWNAEFETMAKEKLRKHQLQELQQTAERVFGNVYFYRKRMNELGISPSDIADMSDIQKLPFMTKDDMRNVYPFGLLATNLSNIIEIHTSSGTTGIPVVDAYTKKDIDIWSEVMARTLAMGDTTVQDTVQNAYGYGLFTGGLSVHYGARKIGANIIPISGGTRKGNLQYSEISSQRY